VESSWLQSSVGWGLHLVDESAAWLGKSAIHRERLFLAKFVDPTEKSDWHGYPADHCRNAQDVPSEGVLDSWIERGLLSGAKVRKIIRGQRCSP
jgi:hypothetical protein